MCVSSCTFVWDRRLHREHVEHFELKKLTKETNPSQKADANAYLDRISRVGGFMQRDAQESLTHNPPLQAQVSFYQRVMATADHPNGAGWSILTGTNMRQPNAHQRARNTCLSKTAEAHSEEDAQLVEAIRRSVEEMVDDDCIIMDSTQSNNSNSYFSVNNLPPVATMKTVNSNIHQSNFNGLSYHNLLTNTRASNNISSNIHPSLPCHLHSQFRQQPTIKGKHQNMLSK